jgi:predicted dehydrogenase
MAVKKEARLLNVGILGCGPISQFAHLESVQKGRNTYLRAVCDADEGLANRFGTFYDADRIFPDYDQMLEDDTIEAVIIGISDAFHVPAAIKALKAGKHVLCEKPIGLSVEEVLELETVVHATGKVLQVGHMLRFDPGIQSAHDFLQGEMGEILALKAWYCDSTARYTNTDAIQPMPRAGTKPIKPQGNPKADLKRYNMLAHGCHLLDLARYLCGPIVEVHARHREKYGAMSWFVDLEFENRALGHLDLTLSVRMDWHEGFQIYGQNGSIKANILNPWYYRASEVDIFREADASTHRVLGADGHFYRRQLEGFADVILKGLPQTGATIKDGLESVRGMVAIMQSAETGKPVKLADAMGPV